MTSPFYLVYPPVSNQEAEWVTKDPAVARLLRSSDLYMIAMRAEATFTRPISQGSVLRMGITADDTLTNDEFDLDCTTLAENVFGVGNAPDTIDIRYDDEKNKLIKLFANETPDNINSGRARPFEWFTTEKLIFDVGRRKPGIHGFTRHREFATYKLLYVGIAKKTDTYQRLFKSAHHKRQQILGNEYPIRSTSRVTDEMFLFAWATDPVVLRTIENEDDLVDSHNQDWDAHYRAVIADAEKAFVHLLNPEYNTVKFENYPQGKDGLSSYGYAGYSFVLAENITFQGSTQSMYGGWLGIANLPSKDADIIVTTGDTVQLYKGLGSQS